MTIWIDIEDLLVHFYSTSRPSGIQRLCFEIYRELWRADTDEQPIRFIRHLPNGRDFEEIYWPDVEQHISSAVASQHAAVEPAPPPVPSDTSAPEPSSTPPVSSLRQWGRQLPADVRAPVAAFVRAQTNSGQALRASVGMARTALRAQRHAARALLDILKGGRRCAGLGGGGALMPAAAPVPSPMLQPANDDQSAAVVLPSKIVNGRPIQPEPADVILSIGASWPGGYYAGMIAAAKEQYGVRFAVMIYDLIPLNWPEWAVKELRRQFIEWLGPIIGLADNLFTISNATAVDIIAFAEREGITINVPQIVPIGVTFPDRTPLPPIQFQPYVLFVSTIETRKNHILMFRLWRRMLNRLPREQVPNLVFAGKIGWLTQDLMAQIENSSYLEGKLKIVESPSDRDLASLYQHCLFTVFPSFYEGWGLPVTESLTFGKTVAASNRASVPEAGGDFCVYFDPEDMSDAYRVITQLILEPERVAVLEARIAREFYPPSWADSAAAIVAVVASGAAQPVDAMAVPRVASLSRTD
jgi:glycosyltransferase involved in cell wall biosynthesis